MTAEERKPRRLESNKLFIYTKWDPDYTNYTPLFSIGSDGAQCGRFTVQIKTIPLFISIGVVLIGAGLIVMVLLKRKKISTPTKTKSP